MKAELLLRQLARARRVGPPSLPEGYLDGDPGTRGANLRGGPAVGVAKMAARCEAFDDTIRARLAAPPAKSPWWA